MNSKLEILWTPLPNKFVTWGSDICLYEVQQLRNNNNPTVRLSNTYGANLLSTSGYQYNIKCLDFYPKSENDLLMAIGNSFGKVTLTTFASNTLYDSQGLPGKDFVPRHQRACSALSWNPVDVNFIAVGYEKYRSDFALLLWDITKSPFNDINTRLSNSTVQPAVELARPVVEYGVSEMVHSLAWFSCNSRQMAAGMNGKTIRLLDFRDPNKVALSNVTKAVYGICIDPHNEKHLASYVDNQIYIWDIRNFEKPISTLSHIKPLLKISWSPTKYNLLGALQKDSSVINLYDIQHTLVGNEEIEPSVLERSIIPGSPHNITSFSWHFSDENRFLTIALSGSIIDYTVFDRITLNWAPTSQVVWTYGCKTMKYVNDDVLNDISNKMKRRTKLDYGLKDELWKNGEIAEDEMLSNVWNWLHLSGKLMEKGILKGNIKHPGVQSVLKIDPNCSKSEVLSITWADLGYSQCGGAVKIYKSEDRNKAMLLCSWHFERDTSQLMEFLDQLEKEGAFTRAAAISVFNLKINQAIELLSRSPERVQQGLSLQVVAMALAGFSDDRNSNWKQYCSVLRTKLNDPYLRALFAFLTSENFNYDNVLEETGIAVDDRVAFACMFLPDNKLYEYLQNLCDTLIEEGNLDGLLLTGTDNDGIKLLQRYLDVTSDIQSTALISMRGFSLDFYSSPMREWIESYSNLLDTWQLWHERAKFDIMLSTYRPNEKPAQQVYISCNFCGKSISECMQGLNRGRSPFTRMGSSVGNVKLSSCPNCRKPLPRCAICLMHMGTKASGLVTKDNEKIIEFSHWFTWCQTCRHGGHASHIVHWFKEHSECPVTEIGRAHV